MSWKILVKLGSLNDYFKSKLPKMMDFLQDNEDYIDIVKKMSDWGVSSREEELLASAILFESPDVIQEIKDPSVIFEDNDVEEIQKYLLNSGLLLSNSDIYCATVSAFNHFDIPVKDDSVKYCAIPTKKAYPQAHNFYKQLPQPDLQKWIQTARNIYSNANFVPFNRALEDQISSWDNIEKLNFKYWLRFYTEGVQNKYPKLANRNNMKTAQYYSEQGFFLPPANILGNQTTQQEEKPADPREIVERQRAKILTRLTSAERLLSSLDGQIFAGQEQELMLKLLQDLKRKVQIVNKKTAQSTIFSDLIYRAGNYAQEFHNSNIAKKFFYKIAQDASADPFANMPVPPGDISDNTPELTDTPKFDSDIPGENETEKAFNELKRLLVDGVYDESEQKEDSLKPSPFIPKKSSKFSDIVVTAQEVIPLSEIGTAETAPPEDKPRQERPKLEVQRSDLPVEKSVQLRENIEKIPTPAKKTTPDNFDEIEVSEDIENSENEPSDDTDDVIEDALSGITIHDAIARLEILVGIYKKREVPRQLAILDIMMDSLGLSSFFPSLGEAMAKSLESSQYISTRLEETLNKLKGSVESKDADDWVSNKQSKDPETLSVQKNLQEQTEKEERRKELRKQKEIDKLEGNKQNQIGEMAEKEMAVPSNIEKSQPIMAR